MSSSGYAQRKTAIEREAPDLLARTRLPRRHPDFVSVNGAYELLRQRRQAPDRLAEVKALCRELTQEQLVELRAWIRGVLS